MLEEIQAFMFRRRSIERRDKDYLWQVIDDSSIPNRGLDTLCFKERTEKMAIKEKELRIETEFRIESSICPRQLFDSKDWPGVHLSEIELNPDGLFTPSMPVQKPSFSYAVLIKKALDESEKGLLSLSEIYKWIKTNFPYYKTADAAWQNSIRHNLSLNKMFVKVKRPMNDPGKGGFWKINPEFQAPEKIRKRDKENF
ncbi:hypothetical protein NEDG_00822 [Nematocida displodere]|uniref:Fork-head domain-containing protein n=1 Tax=Nematocida displodere TaxID=1805483 RepID=A0A177EFC0_9MICR|nr:hypothetical protein NEDG_00822 [Nematocida displodere]